MSTPALFQVPIIIRTHDDPITIRISPYVYLYLPYFGSDWYVYSLVLLLKRSKSLIPMQCVSPFELDPRFCETKRLNFVRDDFYSRERDKGRTRPRPRQTTPPACTSMPCKNHDTHTLQR